MKPIRFSIVVVSVLLGWLVSTTLEVMGEGYTYTFRGKGTHELAGGLQPALVSSLTMRRMVGQAVVAARSAVRVRSPCIAARSKTTLPAGAAMLVRVRYVLIPGSQVRSPLPALHCTPYKHDHTDQTPI